LLFLLLNQQLFQVVDLFSRSAVLLDVPVYYLAFFLDGVVVNYFLFGDFLEESVDHLLDGHILAILDGGIVSCIVA
jgi:hypothetical protein